MNERDKIVLGALFHDIGKVVHRASQRPLRKTHQELGSEWIKGHLSQIFGDDVARELADFALYHHFSPKNHPELDVRNQNRNDLLLVAHADSLSSGEREKIDYDDAKFNPSRPLGSVFSSIKIEGKPEAKPVFYTLRRLSEGIFYPHENLKLTTENYQKILNEFESALKEKMLNPDALLNVLEEHFSLIPSHTAEAEGVGTDVSLYDHLKTTAAIALAAYNYLIETHEDIKFSQNPTNEITDTKTRRYMFIGVDISGIQNFIYTISSKGALKLLRARSFYVEMLLEFLAMRILKELNLHRTNLLFLGGGNFIILAQNTENARKSVDLIIHDFNERLFDEHQGKLWLVHDYVEFEGEVLTTKKSNKEDKRTIADLLKELNDRIRDKKTHKFASFDDHKDKLFEPAETDGTRECKICGVEKDVELRKIGSEELEVCSTCYNLYQLGNVLHKAKYIVYKPKYEPKEKLGEISIYRGEKLVLSKDPVDGEYVWIINPTKDESLEYGTALFLGNYPQKGRNFDPEMKEPEAPPFNYFGAKLVGTLRMDVDNLGYIFSRGLPPEKRSISRLATLSRFFNLFFRKFINDIAQGNLGEGMDQFSIVHSDEPAPREAVVVYAGGDDLFIVGAWHDVIEMAFDIRETFRNFIGGNHITISGGFALNHVKHPIHLFARNAAKAEEEAKDSDGKDALTAFGRTMKWSEWERLIQSDEGFLSNVRSNFYTDVKIITQTDGKVVWVERFDPPYLPRGGKFGELPRGFIYRLMQISDVLDKEGLRLRPFALLAYMLGRNKNLRTKPFVDWLNIAKSFEILRNLKPALMWLDLLLRGQK